MLSSLVLFIKVFSSVGIGSVFSIFEYCDKIIIPLTTAAEKMITTPNGADTPLF